MAGSATENESGRRARAGRHDPIRGCPSPSGPASPGAHSTRRGFEPGVGPALPQGRNHMNHERLGIAFGALIGVAGLFLFARHVSNGGAPQTEPSGITIRSDILTIYAPIALIDFAQAHPEITTNDELVRLIRQAKLNVWFAIVGRNHEANGNSAEVAVSFRPGERPECFDNTKAVLLALAGNRPGPRAVAYRNAKTDVIEDAMMEMEPVDGLSLLLARRVTLRRGSP
jgi:hypothetical protein